jgi:hypothetical protein
LAQLWAFLRNKKRRKATTFHIDYEHEDVEKISEDGRGYVGVAHNADNTAAHFQVKCECP